MKRTVRAVVLAVAVMAMVVPAVSADGTGVWRARTFTCDGEMTLSIIMPPSEYAHAIVPFHVVGSGSVLVPFVFTLRRRHVPVEAARGPAWRPPGPLRVRGPGTGVRIEITGLLTPAR